MHYTRTVLGRPIHLWLHTETDYSPSLGIHLHCHALELHMVYWHLTLAIHPREIP